VIDSVAALVPRAELEGDMGDHHIALQVSVGVEWRMHAFRDRDGDEGWARD
jgi:hypothetical protein